MLNLNLISLMTFLTLLDTLELKPVNSYFSVNLSSEYITFNLRTLCRNAK